MFRKQMWPVYLVIWILFMTGCECVSKKVKKNLDKSEAFSLAYASIRLKYPSVPENIKEWDVYFENGKWYIYPKLDDGELGGGPTAEIDDQAGKVIRVYFSE